THTSTFFASLVMKSEVRIGLCLQVDTTCAVVIPIFNSLNFAHASLCIVGSGCWVFSSGSVDTTCSREPAHALRHIHAAAMNNRMEYRMRIEISAPVVCRWRFGSKWKSARVLFQLLRRPIGCAASDRSKHTSAK